MPILQTQSLSLIGMEAHAVGHGGKFILTSVIVNKKTCNEVLR